MLYSMAKGAETAEEREERGSIIELEGRGIECWHVLMCAVQHGLHHFK